MIILYILLTCRFVQGLYRMQVLCQTDHTIVALLLTLPLPIKDMMASFGTVCPLRRPRLTPMDPLPTQFESIGGPFPSLCFLRSPIDVGVSC